MTRFVVDAPTLLHLVDSGLDVDPRHQLVGPNSVRTEALELDCGVDFDWWELCPTK